MSRGKRPAKEANLSQELWVGYAIKTFVFGFFTLDPFYIVFPVAMADSGGVRTNLSGTPLFQDALWLDVLIPGIFRVPIEVIFIEWKLRSVIRDAWGVLTVCMHSTDSQDMDFWRRPCS